MGVLKPVLKPGGEYSMENKNSQKEVISMKNTLALLTLSAHKIDRQHIQLLLTIIVLAMLVLGVGAPSDGGGPR